MATLKKSLIFFGLYIGVKYQEISKLALKSLKEFNACEMCVHTMYDIAFSNFDVFEK